MILETLKLMSQLQKYKKINLSITQERPLIRQVQINLMKMMDLVILINLNLLSNKNKQSLKPRMTILVILINNQLIKRRKVQKRIAIILEISVITKTILKSLSPMVGLVILMKLNHRNQKMMVSVISMNNLFKKKKKTKTNLKVIMALETSMTTKNLINPNLKMGSEILTIKMTLKMPLNLDNLRLIQLLKTQVLVMVNFNSPRINRRLTLFRIFFLKKNSQKLIQKELLLLI